MSTKDPSKLAEAGWVGRSVRIKPIADQSAQNCEESALSLRHQIETNDSEVKAKKQRANNAGSFSRALIGRLL